MQHKIMHKLKSEEGSSLAFVIIIGVVILMLVASIMAIANSDFTFTQQSLESRQAYIDAKSVIEYGKIEIKDREKKLSDANKELVVAMNENKDDAASKQKIAALQQTISDLENKSVVIYGDVDKVAETLSFTNGTGKTELGKVILEKTSTGTSTGTQTSKYLFKVETENLRRILDYKVDFDYEKKPSGSSGSTGTMVTPARPDPNIFLNPIVGASGWATTKITMPDWQKPVCYINDEVTGSISDNKLTVDTHSIENKSNMFINKFEWANEKPTLDLIAKNICFSAFIPNNQYGYLSIPISNANNAQYNFKALGNDGTIADAQGQIRFQGNYVQNNHEKITMNAKYIVFDGNLIMGSSSNLDITCDTLWIKGDLNINYLSGSYSSLNINAKNIVIEGNLNVGSYSNILLNCPNVWIDHDINTSTSTPVLNFSNVNYLKSGNINLADKCQFTVTGADPSKSQIDVGSIIPYESNAYQLNITNLWSFTCKGLSLNCNSKLTLSSNIIKINGALTLGPQIIDSVINTQYFDCSGMTTIDDLTGDLSIERIADDKPLYVRFGGGYIQTQKTQNQKSVNIGETAKKANRGATLVVFGPGVSKENVGSVSISMGNSNNGYTKAYLNIIADDIWFDSTSITMVEDLIKFWYQGGAAENDKTNIHIGSDVSFDGTVDKASYREVKCPSKNQEFPFMLNNPNNTEYNPPLFPNPPGATGSSSVEIISGPEKYY